MNRCAGIIFSNLHDKSLPELTAVRTTASVPFCCRYRFVDFPLSNMVNADIGNIMVITHCNYHSLMEHIGSGKDWDLARRSGGIRILPPFVTEYLGGGKLYETRLEALLSFRRLISSLEEDTVVLSDCDILCDLDLRAMIKEHVSRGNDITAAIHREGRDGETISGSVTVKTDAQGNVTELLSDPDGDGAEDRSVNLWIVKKTVLTELLSDAASRGIRSFTELLRKNIGVIRIGTFRISGWCAPIRSLCDYYLQTMALLDDPEKRKMLFSEERKIYTRVHNSPPTYYGEASSVSASLLADGCRIEGTVEHSVLFRNVTVERGAVVRGAILFENSVVCEDAELNCVVCDKNSVIREEKKLSGDVTFPLFVNKGRMI